jgi:hypothetical protein
MSNEEQDSTIQAPSVVTVDAGLEAEEYVAKELVRVRKSLRLTQISTLVFCLITVVSVGSITLGFTRSLEPDEAANIAKGLVAEHVNDEIPELRSYIKEKVPILIADVPGYVKKELPSYRMKLESQLESNLNSYADQTSQQFQDKFDGFLTANQAGVKALIDNSQDPQALKGFDTSLKLMFVDYLNHTELNGETLQASIDQTLQGLTEIDSKMKRLAANKNLNDEEKKTRKAIAILLKSVDTNPNIAQAKTVVENLQQNGPADAQKAAQGVLKFTGPEEATFTEPGKPPVALVLKKSVAAPSAAVREAPHGSSPAQRPPAASHS